MNKQEFFIHLTHKQTISLFVLGCTLSVATFLSLLHLTTDITYQSSFVDQTDSQTISTTTTPDNSLEVMLFLGDIMLGRHVEVLALRHGVSYLTASTTYLPRDATAVIANFESAMAVPHIPTASGVMRFSTHTDLLPVLDELRVTHASLANNHALDYHTTGYQNTIAALREYGITAFGHPVEVSSSSVVYIPHNDVTVAVVGIHTLFTEPNIETIKTVLATATHSSDVQVVYIHWGNEYELVHSDAQKRVAQTLVQSGADLIVGHHPHVTQDIQLIDGVPVLYSLGNFIFDQYFSSDVQEGYSVSVVWEDELMTLRLYPHTQTNRSQVRAMTESEQQQYLQSLAERSDPVLYAQIMAQNIVIRK